jgi:hypothetical protein
MEQEHSRAIEQLISHMECSKAFQCYKSRFEVLCRAEDIGLDTYVKCLEETPGACQFSIPFAGGHFCKCPVRIYISKNMGK